MLGSWCKKISAGVRNSCRSICKKTYFREVSPTVLAQKAGFHGVSAAQAVIGFVVKNIRCRGATQNVFFGSGSVVQELMLFEKRDADTASRRTHSMVHRGLPACIPMGLNRNCQRIRIERGVPGDVVFFPFLRQGRSQMPWAEGATAGQKRREPFSVRRSFSPRAAASPSYYIWRASAWGTLRGHILP